MRLAIEPSESLADAIPSVQVIGAPPHTALTVAASVTDAKGQRWRSHGVFHTAADGTIDVARDAPTTGTYSGVDPTGLLWSMEFASEDLAPSMFTPAADQLEFAFTAQPSDGLPAPDGSAPIATTVRRWSAPGVTRSEMAGEEFVGLLFEPVGPGPHPAVAIIHGTTGAAAMEPTAALLASHGYVAMVVAYMGLAGLPESLCEIPLERLAAGVRRLAGLPSVDRSHVAVLGTSVGAEGMLAALAEIPDLAVRAVVATAPSSVIWQAIAEGRPPEKSSWTLHGRPLPYLRIHGERLLPELIKHALVERFSRHRHPRALHLLAAYSTALQNKPAAEQAAIRAEQIDAPILFISGADDQMWPAATMVEALLRRRRASNHQQEDRHLHLADAGHILRPPIVPTTITWTEALYSGGTPQGIAQAQSLAWAEILRYLREHLTC